MIRMSILSVLEGTHEKRKSVHICFQDEARFGRITDPRRCWAPPGIRPNVKKQIVREYTYLYAAFNPINGSNDELILPFMDTECMQIFLDEVGMRHVNELVLMVTD
jgi:hypothetical protein